MGQDLSQTPLSLYLHIPFCLTRCGYCSFFSLPYRQQEMQRYLVILQQELELYRVILQRPLKTIYFGGGSPSLLSAEELNRLLDPLHLLPDAELTLEINPIQITPAYLKALQSTPINRLSIGLQSMIDSELLWLNRKHRASSMPDRIRLCREYGYHNISLDLMYGLPNHLYSSAAEALAKLQYKLDKYVELAPEHISCYLLSLDEDCEYQKNDVHHSIQLPRDTQAAGQYQLIRRTLKAAGYLHYEISNFARNGYAAKHNLCYWQGDEYLGCGAAAAGWIRPILYTNFPDLFGYTQDVRRHRRFPMGKQLSPLEIWQNKLMMGLRLIQGIDLQEPQYKPTADVKAIFENKIERLVKLGMLKQHGSILALTTRALFVSNSVLAELLY